MTVRLDLTVDDLAGIVDLFGWLTREELSKACAELAFKCGSEPPDRETSREMIDEAIKEFALIEIERDRESALLSGPTAFPTLPDHAADLPYIFDVQRRTIDRNTVGEKILVQIRDEANADIDTERTEQLVDVCYDIETWAAIDTTDVRELLIQTN